MLSAIRDVSSSVVPRHRTLDGFVEAVSRADGVGLTDVEAFTTLVVQTDHSVYQITVLQPHTREVVVQGGAFFPDRTGVSEWVELWRQLSEDGLGRGRSADGAAHRGPVDHHVACAIHRDGAGGATAAALDVP